MDERQAFSIIRNVLGLENLAKELTKRSVAELREVYRNIIQRIKDLPDGSIERELVYKALSEVFRSDLARPAQQLVGDLLSGLEPEAYEQVLWAADYVRADIGDLGAFSTRALAAKAVGDTRVLNAAVADLTAPMTKSAWRRVDRIVREGFVNGMTNNQIAGLVAKSYRGAKAEHRAIARTATMSMAQEAHEAQWNETPELIAGWTWDASMDYRVCPVCAPLDGKEVKQRNKLPKAPIHPNCRCAVLPITLIEQIRREEGRSLKQTGDRSIIELVKDKPKEGPGVRVYKQKVKGPDGQMYWKKVTDVAPKDGQALTMAGFLRRANNVTQESVLGKAKAKRFRELIKGTPGSKAPMSEQEALIRVTKS